MTEINSTGPTGEHKLFIAKRTITGWKPKSKGAGSFKSAVIDKLERIENVIPGFDSGYFAVEKGGEYKVNHKELGRVPVVCRVFFSTSASPRSSDTVRRLTDNPGGSTGYRIEHSVDGSYTTIKLGDNYIVRNFDGSIANNGFVRVILWE